MSDNRTFVIIGGGQAGGETAVELRKLGFSGRVIILGEEPVPPYKRPPLSKAYFAGSASLESLYMLQQASLEKASIEFRGNSRVTKIDRENKRVELADGSHVAYDKLVLATGGRARELPAARGDNVFPLRTIADVDAIRARCKAGTRITVIGGGFIGLEVAAVAVKLGMKVTVLEGLPRVLARVTAPEVSTFFERIHREAGVDLRTSVKVEGFEGSPSVTHVRLGDGSLLETGLVIVGIGVVPNVELAQAAGLAVDNGIVVDEFARTADADIYAAGDCTSHPSEFLGRPVRLESVQNAMEQGRAVARNIMGRTEPYRMVPWFWSDQYDLKLQMVGISTGYDSLVLRGDPASQRSFAAFYLGDGKLIAADTVSRPQDFMVARKLVADRAVLDPAKLADDSIPLKSLVPAA